MAGKVFSDIYTESARDTGDQTTSHITYVKKKVNDALREICSEMNYSWLQREVAFPLTASQQAYGIVALAPTWDEDTPINLYYKNAANRRQYLDNKDDHEWREIDDTDEGDPYAFNVSIKDGTWKAYLTYIPSSNFVTSYSATMKMEYQKKPTELSADADIPELPTNHHQAINYWTNALICTEMGDTTGAGEWMALAMKSLGKLKKKQIHRLGRPKRASPRGYLRGRPGRNLGDYNL